MKLRREGDVQPGIAWGPFTLRVPFVHVGVEWPELVQGLVVAGATGLAIVPLYVHSFGMTWEMAVALTILQGMLISAAPIVFGDPFCPGWLTPALPLVLREALLRSEIGERTDFVNAVVLLVAAVFVFFGASGLGPLFLRLVPRVMQAGIILGAGMSALYGELVPRGGEASRLEQYPISILLAVGVSLLLLFSLPVERLKAHWSWLARLAALGIAPGFFLAMVVGPWVGEVSYQGLRDLLFDPATGAWAFGLGDVFFWPDFAGLYQGYSPLARGFPSAELFLAALPLALAAYVIAMGDLITGTAILGHATAARPDETIPFDERRTHFTLGLRNAAQALAAGPFFPLHGPLWTGVMVVVAERYARGRQAMDTIFGGIFSYYVFGIPVLFFCRPVLEVLRPVLPVAFSLTLILTGFACAYVALSMLHDRVERGVAVVIGMAIMAFSTTVGVLAGLVMTVALLGRQAWKPSAPEARE
ncbi:MAG TPA: hypothetical protein VGG06_20205 [Thermoanaerobaculia bacterium]